MVEDKSNIIEKEGKKNIMVDIIMGMVNFLFDAMTGFSGNSIVSPELFNATLYDQSILICNTVVKPIGYTLLGGFCLIELIQITTRSEGQGQFGFEIPMRFMIKVVIAKIFLDQVDTVLLAINEIAMTLITNISYAGETYADISAGRNIIRATIEAQDFIGQIGTLAQVVIMWVLMLIVSVAIGAILYGRMIQLYLYIAIAPIPFSTMATSELSSIGKNFLKAFAAVCLQGVLLFIIFRFYGTLMNSVLLATDFTDWSSAFGNMLMASVVLLLSMVMSGSLAKSMLNAM